METNIKFTIIRKLIYQAFYVLFLKKIFSNSFLQFEFKEAYPPFFPFTACIKYPKHPIFRRIYLNNENGKSIPNCYHHLAHVLDY